MRGQRLQHSRIDLVFGLEFGLRRRKEDLTIQLAYFGDTIFHAVHDGLDGVDAIAQSLCSRTCVKIEY